MLQAVPVCKNIAPIRVQIGRFTAELRREVLVMIMGGKVMISDKDT